MSFPLATPGIIRGILEGVDREQLEEIDDKLFKGIDKERLLNNAPNLLQNLDLELNELTCSVLLEEIIIAIESNDFRLTIALVEVYLEFCRVKVR